MGTTDNVRVRDSELNEREAQKYLQEAVASFTKDPIQGLEDFGWPKYNPNCEQPTQLNLRYAAH